jgi:hypothetical protein
MNDLEGVIARTAGDRLSHLIYHLESDPDKFKKMNPSNGWGSYDSLLSKFLRPLLEMCRAYPNTYVHVWG